MRIHGEAFAVEAAGLVGTHSERHVGLLQNSALIRRSQDGRLPPSVSAGRKINAVRIRWVHRNAFYAGQIRLRRTYPVSERDPSLCSGVPAISATNVRPGIDQVFLPRMKHDAGDKTSPADNHVVPQIRFGTKGGGPDLRRRHTAQQGEDSRGRRYKPMGLPIVTLLHDSSPDSPQHPDGPGVRNPPVVAILKRFASKVNPSRAAFSNFRSAGIFSGKPFLNAPASQDSVHDVQESTHVWVQ